MGSAAVENKAPPGPRPGSGVGFLPPPPPCILQESRGGWRLCFLIDHHSMWSNRQRCVMKGIIKHVRNRFLCRSIMGVQDVTISHKVHQRVIDPFELHCRLTARRFLYVWSRRFEAFLFFSCLCGFSLVSSFLPQSRDTQDWWVLNCL